MAYKIPTTQNLFDAHLARLETAIGQDAPSNEKAFLKVLAGTEAGQDIGLYKYAADAAKQNLALSATADGLDRIGNDNGVPRKQAVTCILAADLNALTGTLIPINTEFTGDMNGLRYKTEADVTAAAGVAAISLRCTDPGTDGNLEIADTLSITAQIAGAETVAEVTAVTQTGIDEESDSDYRPRVLFAQRAITGGANATDHKIWAEAVEGIVRAFPYAGRPPALGASFPGDRTVYCECTTSIDSDGIPPAWLLADVRTDLNTDPETGLSRLVLGITDATLWVYPISRTSIFLEIRDFVCDPAKEAACKSAITDAVDLYFATIRPFVDGVDFENERTDSITAVSLSLIVQDVLLSYGAVCQSIGFGLAVGVFISLYTLGQGELVKRGGAIAYA